MDKKLYIGGLEIHGSKGRDCKSRPAHTSFQTNDEHLDQREITEASTCGIRKKGN